MKGADEADLTLIQLALGFVTPHPGVTSALIGPRTLDHLHSQLAAADTVLSDPRHADYATRRAGAADQSPDEVITD